MENRLKTYSMHLLDLGKKNRLLNYKETGYRTITVLHPNMEIIFHKMTASSVFRIFPLDPLLKEYHDRLDGTNQSLEEYSSAKVFDIARQAAKENDLICYKQGVFLSKVLKIIAKEYQNSCLEKGINPLYMTFGLVRYFDDQDYRAPLFLIPITMKEENGIYKIKPCEEEAILNPTLVYLLKNRYRLSLEEPDTLSFEEYFSKYKEVFKKNQMELSSHVSIGIYSFLKMNMYNDLMTHQELVLQNKNVNSLLSQTPYEQVLTPNPIYPVVDADASQKEAITDAMSGLSFVLQGPPGSGKSQTITNIISSALAGGKKVLFVSEKQAALNVVYENLKRVGLHSFAMALHSHKMNKKDFIDELYKTASLPHYEIQNDLADLSIKQRFSSDKLQEYCRLLHAPMEEVGGKSLYDCYASFLKAKQPPFVYPIDNIKNHSKDFLEQCVRLLDRYGVLAKPIYDYRNSPFYAYINQDLNVARYEAKPMLEELYLFYQTNAVVLQKINRHLPLAIRNYQQILSSLDIIEKVVSLRLFLPDYFEKKKRKQLQGLLKRYLVLEEETSHARVERFFTNRIFDLDLEMKITAFKRVSFSVKKYFSVTYHRLKKELLSYCKVRMKDADLLEKLEEALLYQQKKQSLKEVLSLLPQGYSFFEYQQMNEDIQSLENFPYERNWTVEQYRLVRADFTDILIQLKQQTVFPFEKYTNLFDSKRIHLVTDDLDEISLRLKQMLDQIEELVPYVQILGIVSELKDKNILSYLHLALDQQLPLDDLSSCFEAVFYRNLIDRTIESSPLLKELMTYGTHPLVEEFKKVDQLCLSANQAKIVSALSKQRPDNNIVAGSKFQLLVKEYNKTRKQKPIRLLLEEIWEFALTIKPIFLMSPLSVSTYLNSRSDMFDLVIFDEASQVFAWDALGAIYRAKQCIIIGDHQQLPPSRFFSAGLDDEEEDDEPIESILDQASMVFAIKKLSWHYRSRSEELIAFSNRRFYQGRLITIPQAKRHTDGFGIDFYPTDGIYDVKTQTNRIEAFKVVDLVVEAMRTYPNRSLGVITFSSAQADLIEEVLEERKKNEQLPADYFSMEKDEPFFIKNLESVQGDERDIIIFSICYGYNKEKKFYQRFGPLNNVGGEKRLNVAVTRAKYNIRVVTSIHASDIRLEKTDSLGVQYLKEYLDYAEHIQTKMLPKQPSYDGVLESVCRFLEDQGYLCHPLVGTSDFKIDLAVSHPLTKEYKMAVMLDAVRSCVGSISDVFRLQQTLLERLGWSYYRLFSTDWVYDRKREQEKLLEALDDCMKKEGIVSKPTVQTDFLTEQKEEGLEKEFDEYDRVSESEIETMYEKMPIDAILFKIVEKEEPISIDYLLKRICFMYGRTKVTAVVKKMFYNDLSKLSLVEENGFLMREVYTKKTFRIHSDRTIEQVPRVELEDALSKIVEKNNGITKEGCFKTVSKLLGYDRMSENAVSYLEDALVFLKLSGKIAEKDGCLYC